LSKLPDTERQIAELLTTERLVDDLIAETGFPAAKVGAALTLLEIKGIIKRLPGKRISLK
jgi:predicted Rossmann fold nucleotide-binding protein DprA/Smf involved in DNA uptake